MNILLMLCSPLPRLGFQGRSAGFSVLCELLIELVFFHNRPYFTLCASTSVWAFLKVFPFPPASLLIATCLLSLPITGPYHDTLGDIGLCDDWVDIGLCDDWVDIGLCDDWVDIGLCDDWVDIGLCDDWVDIGLCDEWVDIGLCDDWVDIGLCDDWVDIGLCDDWVDIGLCDDWVDIGLCDDWVDRCISPGRLVSDSV